MDTQLPAFPAQKPFLRWAARWCGKVQRLCRGGAKATADSAPGCGQNQHRPNRRIFKEFSAFPRFPVPSALACFAPGTAQRGRGAPPNTGCASSFTKHLRFLHTYVETETLLRWGATAPGKTVKHHLCSCLPVQRPPAAWFWCLGDFAGLPAVSHSQASARLDVCLSSCYFHYTQLP